MRHPRQGVRRLIVALVAAELIAGGLALAFRDGASAPTALVTARDTEGFAAMIRTKADRVWFDAADELVEKDGSLNPSAVLRMYALTSGRDIPDVDVPRDGLTWVRSGTGPAMYVQAVRNMLTAEQRAAIDAPAKTDTTSSLGLAPGENAAAARSTQATCRDAEEIENQLEPIVERETATSVWVRVICNPNAPLAGEVSSSAPAQAIGRCDMQIGRPFSTYDEPGRRSVIAHELFHCVQLSRLHLKMNELPPWLFEGSAAWYGEHLVVGGTEAASWWRHWFSGGGLKLPNLQYTAIGFFQGLEEAGVDVVGVAVRTFSRYAESPNSLRAQGPRPFMDEVSGDHRRFFLRLATSRAHRSDAGPEWDFGVQSAALGAPRPLPLPRWPTNTPVKVADGDVHAGVVDEDGLWRIEVEGPSAVAWDGGGGSQASLERTDVLVCFEPVLDFKVPDDCKCPGTDDAPAGTVFAPRTGARLLLAAAGLWDHSRRPTTVEGAGIRRPDLTAPCRQEPESTSTSTSTTTKPRPGTTRPGGDADCRRTDPSKMLGLTYELSEGSYVNADGGFLCWWDPTGDTRRFGPIVFGKNPKVTPDDGKARVMRRAEDRVIDRSLPDDGWLGVWKVHEDHNEERYSLTATASGGPGPAYLSVGFHQVIQDTRVRRPGHTEVTPEQMGDAAAKLFAYLIELES